MPNLRRSVVFSFADRYAAMALNLVTLAVLARLLAPEDFGIFAIVAAVTVMFEATREFGIGSYLIQSQKVSTGDLRTAFTLSILLALTMAAIVLLAAEPLALFYADDRVATGLWLAALSFFCTPFSVPPLAMLRRDMRFDRVALTTVAGALAQLVTAVAMALLGFGYLSPIGGMVAGHAATALAATLAGPGLEIYRPSLKRSRAMLAFGGWASATTGLNVLYNLYPQLLLGRVLGFEAAGLMNRAMQLCQIQDKLVMSAIQPVILPLFAERVRDNRALKDTFLSAAGLGFTVQLPFVVCLILLADPIVAVLLGSKWLAVADLLRLLAVGYAFMFAAMLTYPSLVATGRVKDTLIASLISLPPSFLLITIASLWGLHATAIAMSACLALQVYVAFRFVRAAIGFTWRELIQALRHGAIAAACAAVFPLVLIAITGFDFRLSIALGFLAGCGAVGGWILGLVLARHPLLDELRPWLAPLVSRLGLRMPLARS